MNNTVGVCIGVAAFVGGCAVTGVMAADYCRGINDKVTGLASGMKYLQDNIDLNIQSEVADELVKMAAKEVATDVVNKAAESAKKEVAKDINNIVKGNVRNAYSNIEDTLKQKFEKEINTQSIEKIEEKVAGKVAKEILSKGAFFGGASRSDKTELVKTLVENGVPSWEIANIVKAANN